MSSPVNAGPNDPRGNVMKKVDDPVTEPDTPPNPQPDSGPNDPRGNKLKSAVAASRKE